MASGYEPAADPRGGRPPRRVRRARRPPADARRGRRRGRRVAARPRALLNAAGRPRPDREVRRPLRGADRREAAYLVSTSPTYQGYMCKHVTGHLLPRWMRLTDVVRTGRPHGVVNEQADGGAYFREFVEDIFPMSYEAAAALADELGVAKATRPVRVLDLAAGSGVWGVALAEASPRVTVTAVDWPAVLPVTRRIAERHRVLAQFRFVEGDLLDADFGARPRRRDPRPHPPQRGRGAEPATAPQDVRRGRPRRHDRDRRVRRRRGPHRPARRAHLRRDDARQHRRRRHVHLRRDVRLAPRRRLHRPSPARRPRPRPAHPGVQAG